VPLLDGDVLLQLHGDIGMHDKRVADLDHLGLRAVDVADPLAVTLTAAARSTSGRSNAGPSSTVSVIMGFSTMRRPLIAE
jgi:hypothetical protein